MPAPSDAVTLDPARLVARLARLPAAAQLGALHGGPQPVYLVGGAVRDLALGRVPAELDLMVEGDVQATAELLARRDPQRIQTFPQFGTATVTLGAHTYDLAGARRERYTSPGALPQVQSATAEQDLIRRDFTVNAIALGIGGPVRGRLLSVPGAQKDLVSGRLRVLHAASFQDDPTRLLRMARYAARLGFSADADTGALAVRAVTGGALQTVSGTRIGAELQRLAQESDAVLALQALGAYGVGEAIAPRFGLTDTAVARRALALLPADGDRSVTVLGAALLGVPSRPRDELLARLGLAGAARDGIRAAAADASRLGAALSGARTPSRIAAAVGRSAPETVALAGGLDPAAASGAHDWLARLRHVTVRITGDDLLAAGVPPGRAIGAGLSAALAAVLDGRAPSREAELAEALRVAREPPGRR